MICIMHQADPYGHLLINGRPVDPAALARIVGASVKEVNGWIEELEGAGVFTRVEGAITSRRMVRDEDIRNRRARGGQEGAEHGHKGGCHGAKGGRPSSPKGGLQTPLPHESKPPPSSSSSSSSSEDTPIPPAGGDPPAKARKAPAVAFETFLDRCRDTGERPISGYEPVLRYASEARIPMELVNLCWAEFKRRHSDGGGSESKRQADWRRTFLNCLQGNWYRLWWAKAEGEYELTTSGLQAKAVHCATETA